MTALTPLQRAGAAFATAGLWGQTGLPSAADLKGFGYVSFPVGPTSDLSAYVKAVKVAKELGKRVHVAVHHDGQADYTFWPYTQVSQFVQFNVQLAQLLSGLLDAVDTWEVTNEPSADPTAGDTWAQQLPLYQSTLPKARDGVRAAGIKAMILCPVPGNQGPIEAHSVLYHAELPVSVFSGWDGLGCHFYAPSTFPTLNAAATVEFSGWAMNFQDLATKLDMPWVATEYGWHNNNSPDGPRALLAMRSLIETCAALGTCLGGIVWQLRTYDATSCIGNNLAARAAAGATPHAQ